MTSNEAVTHPKRKSTPWHERFGTLFKLFKMPAVKLDIGFDAAKEIPEGDVLIILNEGERWTEAQRQYLPDGVRDGTARYKLLEFKYTESFNQDALEQTVAYNIIYRRSYKLSRSQADSSLLVSRTPHAKTLANFGYQKTAYPGVYRSDRAFVKEVTLVVLNQLSDAPYNAYVKMFASKGPAKRKAIAQLKKMGVFATFTELSEFLFALAKLLFQEETMDLRENQHLMPQELIEAGKDLAKAYVAQLTPEEQMAALDIERLFGIVPPEQFLSSLPPEQRLAGLLPEQRMAGLPPEQFLSSLPPEQRLAGLLPEQRMAGLPPEQFLSSLPPEQRLEGLTLEEIEQYMKQLKKEQSSSTQESDRGSASSPSSNET